MSETTSTFNDYGREMEIPLRSLRTVGIRLIIYSSAVVITALIVATFFVKIPRTVTLPFVIKSDAKEKVLRFDDVVTVEELYVQSSQSVKRADKVLKITSPSIVSMINNVVTAETELAVFEKSDIPLYNNQRTTLQVEQKKFTAQIEEAKRDKELKLNSRQSEIKKNEVELNAAIKNLEEVRKLHKKKFASDVELREAELKKTKANDALVRSKDSYTKDIQALDAKIKQLSYDQTISSQSQAKTGLEANNKRAQLQAEVVSAKQRISNIFGLYSIEAGSLIILAEKDMNVTYTCEQNSRLQPGEPAVKMNESDSTSSSGWYAIGAVTPQNVATIKKGFPVSLNISSFPAYHWGIVRGNVSSLSIAPDNSGAYPIRVQITETGEMGSLIQPGMTGEMSIILEEKTAFEFAFGSKKK
jgi:multidrug efflux pump subunit AcrA (membrane-fusion protein)